MSEINEQSNIVDKNITSERSWKINSNLNNKAIIRKNYCNLNIKLNIVKENYR